jgi:hypothetical protein
VRDKWGVGQNSVSILLVNPTGAIMHWYYFLAYFFGGAFLANSIPHIGNGISGRPFQSPFAKPPGKGLSSSKVNVFWGFFNLAMAYILIIQVGTFDLHNWLHVLTAFAGMLVMSLVNAHGFARFHGGLQP